MFVLLGAFFILLGVLFDDLTTLLLFTKGFGALESNPLYVKFGGGLYITFSVIFYVFMIVAWIYVNKTYYKSQMQNKFKYMDIIIFVFCIYIMFFSITKIDLGINNLKIAMNTDAYEDMISDFEELKETDLVQYGKLQENYYLTTLTTISYLKMWFIVVFGYLFFRLGHRVQLYEKPDQYYSQKE